MGFVSKVMDTIGDAIESVIDNPIGAIVSIGSMAMGIPPIWAGAMGGAANAASHGDNILEGALLGGVTGYAGGAAAGLAGQAGAGSILSGAAGGAAAGATSAALTGGDVLQGALTGGVLGGGTGAIVSQFTGANGNQTYTYDDGSTITRAPDGAVVGSTMSNQYGLGAPVTDLSTYGPGTTNPNAVAPVAPGIMQADGSMVGADGSITYTYDDGSSLIMKPDGTASSTPATNGSAGQAVSTAATAVNQDGSKTNADGSTTYTYDDGSTLTMKPDGTVTSTNAHTTQIFDDGSTLTVDADGNPVSNTDSTNGSLTTPTTGSNGWTNTTGPVVFPVIPVTKPTGTGDDGTTTVQFGQPLAALNTNQGLNPGMIAPTAFYNTNSPVQSQYFWGGHPFQGGDTFNAQLYNQAPAPATPWGLQQMAQPLSPEDMQAIIHGTYQPPALNAPASRVVAFNPYAVQQANAMAMPVAAPVAAPVAP